MLFGEQFCHTPYTIPLGLVIICNTAPSLQHSTECARKLISTLFILTSIKHFLANLHYNNAQHQHRKSASLVAHFDNTESNVIQETQ